MSRKRKTVEIEKLLEYANMQLAREDISRDFKSGICVMIEKVLLLTNTYNGFYFLKENNDSYSLDYYSRKYFIK